MASAMPDIANITGPLLLGYLFNYGLFGVLTVQTYIYYNAFPNDPATFKTLVFGVYIVETIQTIMVTWDAFQNFAYGFGDPSALDALQLLWLDVCIIDGLVAWVVQLYFAYRIHLLSRSKWLAGLIAVMSTAQFGGAIGTGVIAKHVGLFSQIRDKTFIAACFWLGGSAAVDVVIAIAMIFTLSRYDTGFQNTKDLVKRVIRLTMETGSLTAAFATVDLILFLVFREIPYHVTPALALAKVYSNSMLVIFNSRVRIVGGRGQTTINGQGVVVETYPEGALGMDTMASARPKTFDAHSRAERYRNPHNSLHVGVRREIEVDVDVQRRNSSELHSHPVHLNNLESKDDLRDRVVDTESTISTQKRNHLNTDW
ncbi:hypothetical protein PM082_009356 [Marasmius tenuissimus]|nr:hypothetical protein PM082_009356 [Marasmius tenuissimus]